MKKSITLNKIPFALNTFLVMLFCLAGITKSVGQNCQPPPNCQISGNTNLCAGGTTQLCAPQGLSTYSWTHFNSPSPEGLNPTTPCIFADEEGTYSVFVTDQNGCSNSCQVFVTQVPNPQCDITGNSDLCPGSSTQLCASPSLASYSWSTGETTQCIDVITENDFTVTVTDGNGCTCSFDQATTLLDAPVIDAGENVSIPCGSPGIYLNVNIPINTKTSYSILWTTNDGHIDSGDDTSSPLVSSPGTYTVTVTDDFSGCTATDDVVVTGGVSSCTLCNQNTITINSNVTINFNTNPPSYTGDPDLLPYFTFDNSGLTPNLWKASFNIASNRLLIKNGATIKTSKVNGYAPGMEFIGYCDFEMEKKSHIVVESDNKSAGGILLQFSGTILINGEVRVEVKGTKGGLPGDITVATQCGDINQGTTGIIQSIGEDDGGSTVSLLNCGCGNINLIGLTMSYAEALKGDQSINRPNVRIIAFNGGVNIVANSTEPLYDEYNLHGVKYDLWGGVLSWTDKVAKTGKVEIQALKDINVVGHGIDPTGSVRRSFGAVAAVGTASSTIGGIVDVRSLEGKITGDNRSFDVSGKNTSFTNIARINLHAKLDVVLTRSGSNNNYNPVLDARSPVSGGKGGTNDIRSYSGRINIGQSVRVLASVPSGGGSVQGTNLLEACSGVSNLGTVTPADAIPANNTGSCYPDAPTSKVETCWFFIQVDNKLSSDKKISPEEMQLFPNPSNGNVTLEYNSSNTGKYNIQVVSMTGVIVMNRIIDVVEGINMNELDLTNLSKGMYVVILSNDLMKQQKRITIQ